MGTWDTERSGASRPPDGHPTVRRRRSARPGHGQRGAPTGRTLRRLRSSRAVRRAARLRLGAVVLAVSAGGATHWHWQRAVAVQQAWGSSVHVVVADRPLEIGDPVDAGSARVHAAPVGLVPADPLLEVTPGLRAVRPIERGRILGRRDVGDPDDGAASSRLDAGRAGVVVPVAAGTPAVRVGDRVDVVRGGRDGASAVVTTDAEVLVVEPVAVTLAVDGADSARVAALALGEPLGLVLRVPGG